MGFERIGVDRVWEGRIGDVRVERWRMEDGEEVEREVVGHPGAVAVVAHDGEVIYLVS
jgi:ADP-ribose pyrophosphatase